MRYSVRPARGRATHGYGASVRVMSIQSHQFAPIRATTEEAEE
jgi:hypothetical protein